MARELVLCTQCGCDVVQRHFAEHVVRVHSSEPVDTEEESSAFHEEVAFRERNLDAAKLYAHYYRELGRYGSHPSHDGFDDESNP